MVDREKVIKGLECCVIDECTECPYWRFDGCVDGLLSSALSLLKAQEVREGAKMDLEEEDDAETDL